MADNELAEIQSQMDRLLAEVQNLKSRIEVIEAAGGIEQPETLGQRILVCDDARLVRALLNGILSAEGYKVTEAENGQEALDLLEEQTFDCVLMDIHMPDVDGTALLKGIRITQSKVDLPVIVCSGSRDRKDYVQVSQYGVQGILQKPIKKKELLVCIRGALDESTYNASADGLAVFDHQGALDRVGGDRALLLELVVDLLKEWPTLLAGARRAVTGQDAEEIASSAHGLKGIFASLGAEAAAEASNALETMGKDSLVDEARDCYSSLEMELHRLKDEMESYVKANR